MGCSGVGPSSMPCRWYSAVSSLHVSIPSETDSGRGQGQTSHLHALADSYVARKQERKFPSTSSCVKRFSYVRSSVPSSAQIYFVVNIRFPPLLYSGLLATTLTSLFPERYAAERVSHRHVVCSETVKWYSSSPYASASLVGQHESHREACGQELRTLGAVMRLRSDAAAHATLAVCGSAGVGFPAARHVQ